MLLKKKPRTCSQGKRLPPENPFEFGLVMDKGSCSSACQSSLDEFFKDYHCCVSSLADADKTFWNLLRHPSLSSITADFRDRASPYDLGDPRLGRTSSYLLPASLFRYHGLPCGSHKVAHGSEITASCPSNSTVPASCAMGHFYNSLNWPLSCCDALRCVRGRKLFPGACSCLCPRGYGGTVCESVDLFVSFQVAFPDETLNTFDIGKLRHYAFDLSQSLSAATSDIEWEEPAEDFWRRQDGAGALDDRRSHNYMQAHAHNHMRVHAHNRRLLASVGKVVIRVKQTTFVNIERIRLATIDMMCPDYRFQKDFSCDVGPSVYYNGTQLNGILLPATTPPTTQRTETSLLPPPPPPSSKFTRKHPQKSARY